MRAVLATRNFSCCNLKKTTDIELKKKKEKKIRKIGN